MQNLDRLMSVGQFAAFAGVSVSKLRRVLKAAPVGMSFIVRRKRMVDYRELMKWMESLPREVASSGPSRRTN